VQSNRFGFDIGASTSLVVAVEVCTNILGGAWSPVATNTVPNGGGTSYFGDPQWTNYPNQFYRLNFPQ